MNMLSSFQSDNMALPLRGTQVLPVTLDFTAAGTIYEDFSWAKQNAIIDFVQSVYIDNADNPTTLDLIISGGSIPQRIRAQPFTQGYYAVTIPIGDAFRMKCITSGGQTINVMFYSCAMPYVTWGPVPGVLVTPALTNFLLDLEPCVAGDNQLVAAVAAESVKLYRLILSVGAATVLKFYDNPSAGGTELFAATLFAGGGLALQVSGVPWFNTGANHSLVLNSSNAVNIYGGYGVTQS
jgi:hypothetical protein